MLQPEFFEFEFEFVSPQKPIRNQAINRLTGGKDDLLHGGTGNGGRREHVLHSPVIGSLDLGAGSLRVEGRRAGGGRDLEHDVYPLHRFLQLGDRGDVPFNVFHPRQWIPAFLFVREGRLRVVVVDVRIVIESTNERMNK